MAAKEPTWDKELEILISLLICVRDFGKAHAKQRGVIGQRKGAKPKEYDVSKIEESFTDMEVAVKAHPLTRDASWHFGLLLTKLEVDFHVAVREGDYQSAFVMMNVEKLASIHVREAGAGVLCGVDLS